MNHFAIIALFSFMVSMGLVLMALKYFPKWGWMDRPEKYGLDRKPIPYYGGILIFLAFLISVLVFVDLSKEVVGLLAASFLIVLIGVLDDWLRLNPFLRIFVQVLAALVLIWAGIGILSITNPLGGVFELDREVLYGVPVLGALFTVIWIVAITNTMNFLDGVGGLSSGVSFIASLTIFFLSVRPDIHVDPASQLTVASIALILAFVTLAFLVFDFPPAKILMGDSGSTFFGFVLATLAIFSGGKVATAFLVLGIPILDAGWVISRRLFEGKKPWQGDLKHLHHRLLELGLEEHMVLYVIYGFAGLFGVLAVVCVSSKQKLFVLIGLVVLMLLMIAGVLAASKHKKKLN
jgi:UDP-GlcNAc:undecaprenyl-phosphate/decaprenyl-phosphate GlcNAc-1-phosphate transferase